MTATVTRITPSNGLTTNVTASLADSFVSQPSIHQGGPVYVTRGGNDRSALVLHAYVRFCRAQSQSESTIRLRLVWLKRAARDLDLAGATTADLIAWLAEHNWQPETRRAARGALRSFYQWAEESGTRDDNPAARLRTVRVPTAMPRPCPTDVLHAALNSANDRDRMMIALAAFAGLRCAEIAGLRWADVTGQRLRIRGKGGKVRSVPISPALSDLLDQHAVGSTSPFVVPSRNGEATPTNVSRRLKRALGGQWTAHTLRHRFATMAYRAQRDLLTVQRLLGHSTPETTARYAEPPAEAALAAVMNAAA